MIKFKKKKAILSELIIPENYNIAKATKIIDLNAQGLGFVCKNKKILGIVTDGDIRRFIYKSGDLAIRKLKLAFSGCISFHSSGRRHRLVVRHLTEC